MIKRNKTGVSYSYSKKRFLELKFCPAHIDSEDKIEKLKHLPIKYFQQFRARMEGLSEEQTSIITDLLHSFFHSKQNFNRLKILVDNISLNAFVNMINL